MPVNWEVISVVLNVVIAAISALLIRWVAGIVRGLQQDIRIAVLELKEELTKTYATKPEIEALRDDFNRQIELAGRVDNGFALMAKLLAKSGGMGLAHRPEEIVGRPS